MPKSLFVDFKAIKTAITMEQVLEHYSLLESFKRSGDSLSGPCPIHKGSNPTQFRVSIAKNVWHVFSECKQGGNVLDFIAKVEDVSIRRKAYELFVQHRRKGFVARELNAAGYRTRDGAIWRDTSIARILDESSAKGIFVFNTVRAVGNWKNEPKPENEWGKVECEPIVSENLWNQVNQLMEEQLKAWKKPGKPPVHLFSGLAFCSCGSKMYVNANTPKYFCRKCRNKIPIVDLEDIVRQELKAFFGQPERIAEHLKNADQNLAEKSSLLDAHEREIQKVRDEMTRTHRLYKSRLPPKASATSTNPPNPG
jgi:hypothetical protein